MKKYLVIVDLIHLEDEGGFIPYERFEQEASSARDAQDKVHNTMKSKGLDDDDFYIWEVQEEDLIE